MALINLLANEKFKKLGAKWDGKEWVAPKLAQKEFDAIKNEFYADLIPIEVTITEKYEDGLKGQDWAYKHVKTIAGYIVASVRGRDDGAEIFENVAVIEGKFDSAGSRKNYFCQHTKNLTLRMEVSRNALPYLDKEKENRYEYKLLEVG